MSAHKKIGIIDADLLDKGTNFPNLALMKLSGYHKAEGHEVALLRDYASLLDYDTVFVSKVFLFTKVPNLESYANVVRGGSGFFFDKSPALPEYIEHTQPDYGLYSSVLDLVRNSTKYYTNYSIGFTTRGCFRKCSFCINRNCEKVERASVLEEFLDSSKKRICLLDDNILGYSKWRDVLEKLVETGHSFQYKQGLDIRLLTPKKAEILVGAKYDGDYIFAFDNYDERDLIESKIQLWVKYWQEQKRRTKFYVLTAYESQDVEDIVRTFERIKILMKYGCFPYVMRYRYYKQSQWESIYTSLANWCNQPHLFAKLSFRECCVLRGMSTFYKEYRNNWDGYLEEGHSKYKSWRILEKFEKQHPEIATKYFDLKFEEVRGG